MIASGIDTIQSACTTTSSGATGTNANATNANGTNTTTEKDDKCKNGVSQYVLAPIIAVVSLFTLLA